MTAIEISDRFAGEIQRDPGRFRPSVRRYQEVVGFPVDGTRLAVVGRVDAVARQGEWLYVRTHAEPLKQVLVRAWAPVGGKDDSGDADTRPVKGGRVLDLHRKSGVRRAVVVEQTYVGGPIGILHPVEGSTLTEDWALLPEALTMDDEGTPTVVVVPWDGGPTIPLVPRPLMDPLLQQRLIEQLDRELAEARAALAERRQAAVNDQRIGRITALRELVADMKLAGDRTWLPEIERRIAALEAKTNV